MNRANLLQRLAAATPKINVAKWLACTMLYALVIILNDHFHLVAALGMPAKEEAILRLIGAYLYIIITIYHFQKRKPNENTLSHTQKPPRMAPVIRSSRLHDAARPEKHKTRSAKVAATPRVAITRSARSLVGERKGSLSKRRVIPSAKRTLIPAARSKTGAGTAKGKAKTGTKRIYFGLRRTKAVRRAA